MEIVTRTISGFKGALDAQELYNVIGQVVVAWSHTEDILERCIWQMLSVEEPTGMCVTTHMGAKGKLDAFSALARLKCPDEIEPGIRGISKEVDDARAERNRIAHGIWDIDPTGFINPDPDPVRVRVSARGNLKIEEVSVTKEQVSEILSEIVTCQEDLERFFNETIRPHLS